MECLKEIPKLNSGGIKMRFQICVSNVLIWEIHKIINRVNLEVAKEELIFRCAAPFVKTDGFIYNLAKPARLSHSGGPARIIQAGDLMSLRLNMSRLCR